MKRITERDPRRRRAGLLVAGLAAVALLVAACGGGSPGSDLDPNNPTYRAGRQAGMPVAAAHRLHEPGNHGITDFPDPDPHGHLVDLRGIDLYSPQFKAAQQACRHYLGPNGKGGGGQ